MSDFEPGFKVHSPTEAHFCKTSPALRNIKYTGNPELYKESIHAASILVFYSVGKYSSTKTCKSSSTLATWPFVLSLETREEEHYSPAALYQGRPPQAARI